MLVCFSASLEGAPMIIYYRGQQRTEITVISICLRGGKGQQSGQSGAGVFSQEKNGVEKYKRSLC